MLPIIKKAVSSNITLKAMAVLMGYVLWSTMSQSQPKELWITIPVSVHSLPDNVTMHSPDTIAVHIAGRKSDLCTLDRQTLALHVDGHHLHAGNNLIPITNTTLFLPDTIKLLHYKPHHVVVTIASAVTNQDQPTIIT